MQSEITCLMSIVCRRALGVFKPVSRMTLAELRKCLDAAKVVYGEAKAAIEIMAKYREAA